MKVVFLKNLESLIHKNKTFPTLNVNFSVPSLQNNEFAPIGSPHPNHVFTDHTPLLHCFSKSAIWTKFSIHKFIHTLWKNLSVADMLSHSSTKTELQPNQHKHKQLPPQVDFVILQDHTLKHVHYLIKHEEILPHQKHDVYPILAGYGTDQISIRIINKGNNIIVKFWDSFFLDSFKPFQTKFKSPIKSITNFFTFKDDKDHIYTRIPTDWTPFIPDETLMDKKFSTLIKSQPNTFSINAIETRQTIKPPLHKLFHFLTHLSLKTKLFPRLFPISWLPFRSTNS